MSSKVLTKKKRFWLVKGEPNDYTAEDWQRDKVVRWDGIRNFQARNFLLEMKKDDEVFLYYSSCATPGVAARGKVAREAYPDSTAWDKKSPFFDPKEGPENPRWFCVDLAFLASAEPFLPTAVLKKEKALAKLPLFSQPRLSVMPLSAKEFEGIVKLCRWRA